jgi:hypothetical protein
MPTYALVCYVDFLTNLEQQAPIMYVHVQNLKTHLHLPTNHLCKLTTLDLWKWICFRKSCCYVVDPFKRLSHE